MLKFNNEKIGKYVRTVTGKNFAEVGRLIDEIVVKDEVIEITELEIEKEDGKYLASFCIYKINN